MHDIRVIRDNPEAFDRGLARRGISPESSRLISLDDARRRHVSSLQSAQERRNALSAEIGQAMKAKHEARARSLKEEVATLKEFIDAAGTLEAMATKELEAALGAIPNIPLDDVPDGTDETGNVVRRTHGTPADFPFAPRQHFEIGHDLGLMDFEAAARISGSRFVVLKGALSRLERALAQFMLDVHTQSFGYLEVSPPALVRDQAMYGTAQLPKFADDQFRTTDGFWLIPTAEVSLTNLVRETIMAEDELPIRYTAWTQCFRAEAGAAGRDMRGMIRQHQFSKVELVSITTPEESLAEHERMLSAAEEILKRLELPYRVMTLCAGDMGFSARKTYDIEVWLPGQGAYREISSCSVCGDFQARRMNARYRPSGGGQPRHVHTLNGSGLAVGRTMVAILENFQNADGTVTVPSALVPYMAGAERIGPLAPARA